MGQVSDPYIEVKDLELVDLDPKAVVLQLVRDKLRLRFKKLKEVSDSKFDNNYKTERELGRGNFGVVIECSHY